MSDPHHRHPIEIRLSYPKTHSSEVSTLGFNASREVSARASVGGERANMHSLGARTSATLSSQLGLGASGLFKAPERSATPLATSLERGAFGISTEHERSRLGS